MGTPCRGPQRRGCCWWLSSQAQKRDGRAAQKASRQARECWMQSSASREAAFSLSPDVRMKGRDFSIFVVRVSSAASVRTGMMQPPLFLVTRRIYRILDVMSTVTSNSFKKSRDHTRLHRKARTSAPGPHEPLSLCRCCLYQRYRELFCLRYIPLNTIIQ